MLPDHRRQQELSASAARRQRQVVPIYGDFIATLRIWVWFLTITLRDRQSATARMAEGALVKTRYQCCDPDPRIADWMPTRHGLRQHDPTCDAMRTQIAEFFGDLQRAAGTDAAWIIAEDFGRGNRFHCHAVVDGVEDLDIDHWRAEASRRFGISRIEPYDPMRGGARYLAKNGLRETGNLHFGGTLADLEIDAVATQAVGRVIVAKSADMPSQLYHMTLGRRRKR